MTVFSDAYGQKNTQLDESWAKWIIKLSMPSFLRAKREYVTCLKSLI